MYVVELGSRWHQGEAREMTLCVRLLCVVWLQCLPFDAAIVFRADRDGTICLLSNFYRDSAEVQTAIAESKVFRRLFAASEEKAHL